MINLEREEITDEQLGLFLNCEISPVQFRAVSWSGLDHVAPVRVHKQCELLPAGRDFAWGDSDGHLPFDERVAS